MKPQRLAPLLLSVLSPSVFAGLPGPELVKDIRPGAYGSLQYEGSFGAVGNTLFLAADDGTHGIELWRSDGTPGGTVQVKELRSGVSGGVPRQFVTAGNFVFFSGGDLSSGNELWRSDGTATGTIMLRDIVAGTSGSHPRPLGAAGSTLYFTANEELTNGGELWKSNGTPGGTVKVTTIGLPNRVHLGAGVELGGVYYFRVSRDSASELWRTNGTEAGTRMLSKVSSPVVVVGNRLFFYSKDEVHGRELWSSDGTSAGTLMVKEIAGGSLDGVPSYGLMAAGDLLYFSARTSSNNSTWALWRSDGTSAGTFPLMRLAEPFGGAFHLMGNRLYFTPKLPGGTSEVWKSDGTVAGTGALKAGTPGGKVGFFANGDGSFFFYSSLHDRLWQSDGTAQGTRVVADLFMGYTGAGNDVHPRSINGKLLFGVYNPAVGKELYRYDTMQPSIARPVVSEITPTSARVDLALNPNGSVSSARFEYGLTDAYGTTRYLPLAAGEKISRFQDFPVSLAGLSSGTTYHYRITATNTKGTHVATGTFRTGLTRETWRAASFGAASSSELSADDSDPDGDGLSNLIEYAFGLDPGRSDAGALPRPSTSGQEMVFEFTHPEGQEDLIYGVEWSPSMAPGSWTAVPDTGSGNHHRFVVETSQKPRVFTRWTVNPR